MAEISIVVDRLRTCLCDSVVERREPDLRNEWGLEEEDVVAAGGVGGGEEEPAVI